MTWIRPALLLTMILAVGTAPAQHRTRIARPLKKIHTDTIAIPDDMVFFTDDTYEAGGNSGPQEPEITGKKDKNKKKRDEESRKSGKKKKAKAPDAGELRRMEILGDMEIDVETMYSFVCTRNPDFPREIAEAFHRIGKRYGVRGDIALCQSIIETGWFMFTGGTAVTPGQNNFCGLGVTRLGMKGHSFKTIDEGVTAQIQHLYAYACKKSLPKGEKLIDPRFTRVTRGIAPRWQDLDNRWAANNHYADSILALYQQMCGHTPD